MSILALGSAGLAGAAVALGAVVVAVPNRPRPSRRVAGHPLSAAVRRPAPWRQARRRWMAALAGAFLAVTAPPLLGPVAAGWWIAGRHRRLRARQATARAVTDTLPDAVDLLLLCTTAGLSLPLAHPLVAAHVAPPLGPALLAADAEADAGRLRADALVAAMTPLGERAAGLGHALADHLRYGVPLAAILERWGAELRSDRRRQAEESARRVPVRLLGPLILCVLPAFGLLTVIPLLVASLRALPT